MNLWSEVAPEGSNVWVCPRDTYDCVMLVAMNKSGRDALIEIDYSDSKGAAPFTSQASSSSASPSTADGNLLPRSLRSHVAAQQTTVIAVFRPEVPFLPMQVSYRASVAAVARREDEPVVDVEGSRLLVNSTKQSQAVEEFLRSRQKGAAGGYQ